MCMLSKPRLFPREVELSKYEHSVVEQIPEIKGQMTYQLIPALFQA